MLNLGTTSTVLRMVTGAAASVTVDCDYVDLAAAGATSAGTTLTPAVTTATTTTIVAAPGASGTIRNVKAVRITNNHVSASTQVTVQKFDGTNAADLIGVTLLPGENLIMLEDGDWRHHDVQGAEYSYQVPAAANLGPTGTLAETFPRALATTNTAVAGSGVLFLQAIYLTAGQLVSNIGMISGATAAGTPTNYFFALYDENRALRAQSANQTTTAWAAQSAKDLAMTTPYRVPTSGLYYIGFMMTATTVATVHGGPTKANAVVSRTAPILHGVSTTSLTTALPDPADAIIGGTASIYAWVS